MNVHSLTLFHFIFLLFIITYVKTEAFGRNALKFDKNGKFKIVQFTDLHYGEQPPLRDIKSAMVQNVILEAESPNMVIMTGDCVSGYAWNGKKGWWKSLWKSFTAPMIKHNVPWAIALGNHDDQADLNRKEIVELDSTNPLSYTQLGPDGITGVTNYFLPVYSSNSTVNTNTNDPYKLNSEVVSNLWIFDSNDNQCLGVKGWGCVYPDAVEWYRQTSSSIKKSTKKIIPGISFLHIPPPEFMNVWNYRKTNGRLEDEGVCCFSVNTGLFAAMKQQEDILSIHCGHDHNNDYFGDYEKITLAYGRKTGYGGYGPPNTWLRGARVIELTENPFSMKMWIRQEDGSRIDHQPFHLPGSNQTFLCCDSEGVSRKSNCHAYATKYAETHGVHFDKH